MKKITLFLMACCMSLMAFAAGSITYDLDGGVWNDYGWANKSDMFVAFTADVDAKGAGTGTWATFEAYMAAENPFTGAGGFSNNSLGAKFTATNIVALNDAKWLWLKNHLMSVDPALSPTLTPAGGPTPALWRYSLAAFWMSRQVPASLYATLDFTDAGQPEAIMEAWGQAFPGPATYDGSTAVFLPSPKKADTNFAGWYKDAAFTDGPITSIPAGSTGNFTLYAKWAGEALGGEISYNLNGGKWDGGISGPIAYDGVAAVAIPEPVKREAGVKGFAFAGWYTDAAFTEGPIDETPVGTKGNIILYAKWTQVSGGTIAYNLDGGKWNEYGWETKSDMLAALNGAWNAFAGSESDWTSIFTEATTTAIRDMVTADAQWMWLADYLDAVSTAQSAVVPSTNEDKRFFTLALDAFFQNTTKAWNWITSANFELAGLPQAFNAAWGQALPVTSYDGVEATPIPVPTKGSEIFGGWYKDAAFTEGPIDEIPAGTMNNFTLYADWRTTGIKDVKMLSVWVKGGEILVPVASGKTIEVFSVLGQKVKSVVSQGNLTTISGLPQNQIYLVKVDGEVAKVKL